MADNFDIDSTFIPALHKPAALLPITKHHDSILYTIETYPVTIIIGQTGSGKTTQIPQFLHHAGWCKNGKTIAITQPRRVAATTIAMRVAQEFGCELGQEVGFAIRFEDVTSPVTRIKFMTDGLLIHEALMDPLLSKYSVIMVDEAHERSLSTDILLGLLKKIRRKRPELRIVISSATLQAEQFLKFFEAKVEKAVISSTAVTSAAIEVEETEEKPVGRIVSIEGRTFPISNFYLEEPTEDYVERAVKTVLDIHSMEPPGDVLVFLTGRDEINTAVDAISTAMASSASSSCTSSSSSILALPLYAGLSTELQMLIFDETPPNTRKVVFATNIAEASLTIPNIIYVVDCGFAKIRSYDPITRLPTLTAAPISRASAAQRAGRAGRTAPGKCFRLYTESAFSTLPPFGTPEIQRTDLAPVILQLKALGIDNVLRFDFLSPPPAKQMQSALELLYALGALDDYAKLTKPLGLRMAELAVEPMAARALLAAPERGVLSEMLTISAMLAVGGAGSVWVTAGDGGEKGMEEARRLFAAEEGDLVTLLNAYTAFVTVGNQEVKFCSQHCLNYKALARAVSIRSQLKKMLERFQITVIEPAYLTPHISTSTTSKPQHPSKKPTLPPRSTIQEARYKSQQIIRTIVSGFFAHAAKMQPDGSFRSVSGAVYWAHPSSLMFRRKTDWVVFQEALETGNKTYIRDLTAVELDWLVEAAPEFYKVRKG